MLTSARGLKAPNVHSHPKILDVQLCPSQQNFCAKTVDVLKPEILVAKVLLVHQKVIFLYLLTVFFPLKLKPWLLFFFFFVPLFLFHFSSVIQFHCGLFFIFQHIHFVFLLCFFAVETAVMASSCCLFHTSQNQLILLFVCSNYLVIAVHFGSFGQLMWIALVSDNWYLCPIID